VDGKKMTTESHEVTKLLDRFDRGDEDAFGEIWDRIFPALVDYASRRVGHRQPDAEDHAMSAMKSLWRGFQQGRFAQVGSRDDLWRLLVTITARKITASRRNRMAQKRGEGLVPVAWDDSDVVAGSESTPAEEVEMLENFDRLLTSLPDETLRQVALLRLEGYNQTEIASQLDCATRTVKRKIALIRRLWSGELRSD
jgi:RNA polymerase sigma factor (sigma-70 family)